MIKKLNLAEMAALAEVVGTIGVVVSLLFVVISINKNTVEATATSAQSHYDSVRQLEMAVAADPLWSEIVVKGRKKEANLSEVEQFRYDAYVVAMFDIWDHMQARFDDELMVETDLVAWENYFKNWGRRNVSAATWDRIKWNFSGPVVAKIAEAVGYD